MALEFTLGRCQRRRTTDTYWRTRRLGQHLSGPIDGSDRRRSTDSRDTSRRRVESGLQTRGVGDPTWTLTWTV